MLIPWKKIGEPEILAQGFGKSFSKQQFIDHNGEKTDFFFYDQPEWSIALPITKEGNVITVLQYKQGADAIMEELPGGTANFNKELPEIVIKREILEETGYQPEKIIFIGSGFTNSRNSHTRYFQFLALGCTKISSPNLDSSEQIEVKETPLKEWLEKATKDESIQWDSCVATVRALPHLNAFFKDNINF